MLITTQKSVSIKIGHGAYSGANALKFVSSKAAAVRELRARGVLRDAARTAVNAVCKKDYGYATIRAGGFDVIEVFNNALSPKYGGRNE